MFPGAAVPEKDGAGTVIACRDQALEATIRERMIFGTNGQTLVGWIETRAAGHSPAQQNAVELQAEVIVLACRPVMLDNEQAAAALAPVPRFGGFGEIPFCLVGRQRALSHDR